MNFPVSATLYRIRTFETASALVKTDLFPILEQLLPVRFVHNDYVGADVAGEIRLRDSLDSDAVVTSTSIWSLSFQQPLNRAKNIAHVEFDVKFSNDPDVPFPFRGRVVRTSLPEELPTLSLRENEKVLAASRQGTIWTMSVIGLAKHFRSALPLPEIATDQNFSDVFNEQRFLKMLPLLHFLRGIGAATAYQSAPLRAGFIIDDPNLHWPRYGFADYRAIAAHARTGGYHVAFATIPLDTWYTNTKTAELFRRNSQWLSLLVHGNNHGKEELAANKPHAARTALLQQAIRRIERLEQGANMRVSRVMVPPHGACSSEMLAELPRCGFESACISAGSLRAHNRNKSWTKTLGFFPSEIIEGCPVLPRWGLTGSVENTLLLAAYLGQPMVLRGHHQDFRNGIEMFDEFAKFINGLGDVFWSNMTDLSRLNYLWRMERTTCRVKPLGTNIDFELPKEATEVIVEKFSENDDCAWRAILTNGAMSKIESGGRLALTGEGKQEILLERIILGQKITNSAPISVRLILRRLLTEVRDRLLIS